MAKILVINRDNPGGAMNAFRAYDVVAVYPDDHVWSPGSGEACFIRFEMPGTVEDFAYLVDGEPSTLRDDYPLAMLRIPRLYRAMRHNETKDIEPTRRFRGWSMDADGVITRKQIGADNAATI